MPTGTVKWFNATKGYGFIAPDDGSKDAFVHVSGVERAGLGTLREGQRLRYELRPGRNGKFSPKTSRRPTRTAAASPRGPAQVPDLRDPVSRMRDPSASIVR